MKNEAKLRELYQSLDERWTPEQVAKAILQVLDVRGANRRKIEKAAKNSRNFWWSSMSHDFERHDDMSRQLKVAQALGLGNRITFQSDDLQRIERWLKSVNREIGKEAGKNDFKHDRLTKEQRQELGIDISRRQYNKRFRMAVRLEKKAQRMKRNQFKRSLALASKTRLASEITWEEFSKDAATACFIAYYVARCNKRSLFTNTRQERPYDTVCESLMQKLRREKVSTNWWALAHVLPNEEVVRHLTDDQKGQVLGAYFDMMHDTALFLKELFNENEINEQTMIVRRGNDSTTWNLAAGAWNKLRQGWFELMYALGMTEAVEKMCPGKVLRLMAADVAWWHRSSGGDLHDDTAIWRDLPRPWEVFSGDKTCSKEYVDAVCAEHNADPVKSGWSAPKPGKFVEEYTPTQELVHGVVVSSPLLAKVFRKAGVFSGKKYKGGVSVELVDKARQKHHKKQTKRRKENTAT